MAHIAVLASDANHTLVEVDPAGCSFSAAAPMGSAVGADPSALVVNANYYNEADNTPLGVMVSAGQALNFEPISTKSRTALVVANGAAQFTDPLSAADVAAALANDTWSTATVIQAGPRLIANGEIIIDNGEDPEQFAGSGALVRSKHVAIGINGIGKLLFLYMPDNTPLEFAQRLLANGAVDAMKVDGGHAAYLRFGAVHRGAVNPFTALIVAPNAD